MATSKTLTPTNVTIQIPAFTDKPDQRLNSNCIDKEADAINALSDQMASVNSITKSTGSKELVLEAIGYQYNASTILVSLSLPFNTNNTSYSVTLTTVSILGQGAVSLSDVTIDSKGYAYIRLSIAKNGTVGTPMLINARLTLTLS